MLNLNFGREPRSQIVNGVCGSETDEWTLIDHGELKKEGIKYADGTPSDVEVTVSANDGEWGVADHYGVAHAYVYHNCRCVDLAVTLKYLSPGTYDVYVVAHGDAPNQNAAIEIQSGRRSYSGKATLNDGTWNFRQQQLEEGNQYVWYRIEVSSDTPVVITSRRDGSNLSMFNAIQLAKVK